MDGLVNDPGGSPDVGSMFYNFTVLGPDCVATADTEVSLKITYDNDGNLTAASTVDLELTVQAWENTEFVSQGDQSEFAACIQTDILIVDESSTAQLLRRKYFDFDVTPVSSTFTVNNNMTDNSVPEDKETASSGTTVTASWDASNPLNTGETIWFHVTI
jgi:hypothetical protein